MKFYQTIASVVLSILCATTILGSEETSLPPIPEDIYNLIDEFRKKNDSLYEETGHVKPYSPRLNLTKKKIHPQPTG